MRPYLLVPLALAALSAAPAVRAAGPSVTDCLTATETALKLRANHKLRQARKQLLICAEATCPADIRKECVGRVTELNEQIPTIFFGAKDASGADLSAVKVTMDGEVLTERLEGTPLSINPGEHTFTFEAAGLPPVTRVFLIQQGQKDRRETVAFAAATAAPKQAPTPQTVSGTPPPAMPEEKGPGMGTQKVLAIVTGSVGVVGLGLGTAFGVMAMSKKSDAQNACPANPCPTQDGVNKWSSAGSSATISTIGFIVGGVGIAGAAVLWFTAPRSSSGAVTQVGIGPGSLQLRGTW